MNSSFCVRCKLPGILQCSRCFDIYCSANCQSHDWAAHRNICFPMPQLVPICSFLKPCSDDEQTINKRLTACPKSILPPSKPEQLPKISKPDHRFKPNPAVSKKNTDECKWKHHVSIECMMNEYFEVIIQNVVLSTTTTSIFVIEARFEEKFDEFLKTATKIYEKPPVNIKYTFNVLKIGQLVMIPFKDELMYRAEVIGKDDLNESVQLRLVDCGTEWFSKNFDQFRRPTSELINQEAFGFEVFVDSEIEFLKQKEKIMIKLTKVSGRIKKGEVFIREKFADPNKNTIDVEVKKSDELSNCFNEPAIILRRQQQEHLEGTNLSKFEKMNIEVKNTEKLSMEKDNFEECKAREMNRIGKQIDKMLKHDTLKNAVRHYLNELNLEKLKIAEEIKVKFLDLSLLMDAKIVTVCESTPENLAIYEKLQAEIQKYCSEKQDEIGYQPVAGELILAKFDNKFFRAICMNVLKGAKVYSIQYIDYGNIADISSNDAMRFPKALLSYPSIAHVCFVKGFDGILSERRINLMSQESISAVVTHGDNAEGFLYNLEIVGF